MQCIDISKYNPLIDSGGILRSGQAEAITSMVANFEKGVLEQTLKAPTAAGKCLGKDTSIIMFDGTTKKVQDINPGDLLMGPDSQSRRVISTTQGFGQLYKIVPTWGKSFICNDAHILNLKNTYRETKSDNYKGFYQIGETLNISISEYIKTSNNFKHHMKLWHAAIKFPEIPIQWSPYIIGVWIGDGDFNTLSITNPDIEIYDEFERYASELGLEFREYFNEGCGNARRFGIKNHADLGNPEVVKNANTLYRFVMNNCRVNGEKRLPASYMINSESIRLQLLAGLIDSDGWNSGTYYEFTTKYEGLAKDVAFLASSLGFESRATQIQSRHQSWEPNRTSTYHVITICGEVSRIPCKVERKKSTYVHKQRIPLTSSFKVVDAGNDNYYGFMLEGDGLFLLGDFTVTHNTLDLVAFGNILKDEFGVKKVLFTSPQVALVETGNLFGLPKLVGKANYPCPGLQGCTAEDCLFPGNTPKLWSACDDCPYNKAKAAFRAVDFGATTFARYLVDPMIRRETSALLIDESSNLFDSLIDSSSIEIPEKVFEASQESSLHSALHAWWSQLLKDIAAKESRLKLLRADLKDMKSPDKKLLDEAKKVQKECSSLTRKADAANKAMGYIKKEVPYIVTSEEEFRYVKGKRGQKVKTLIHNFRLLDAKIPYHELVTGLQCVILASGTPTTSLLTTDPKHAYVTIQHPIDPGRRTVTYKPIGSMNYTERYNTAPKMAREIIQLHNQYHRNTLVHCGNYEIAKLLMDGIDGKANVLLQDRSKRKDNFNSWFEGDDTIFLSVNFEQGMDCKGEKFPMNIIAKVPFPNLGSQWVKARNNLDSWQWYNMQTALMVMQACGRTTRTPQDYSETYICDTSFAGFYNRNKGLFFDWFQAALRGF